MKSMIMWRTWRTFWSQRFKFFQTSDIGVKARSRMTKLRVDGEGSVDPGWGKIMALKDVFKDSPPIPTFSLHFSFPPGSPTNTDRQLNLTLQGSMFQMHFLPSLICRNSYFLFLKNGYLLVCLVRLTKNNQTLQNPVQM